jgi:hypothetical protein
MAVEAPIEEAPPTPSLDHTHATTSATKPVPAAAWAMTAVSSIWLSVFFASTYAPDFVSGSRHEHLQLVGGLDWIWGLVATAFVVLAAMQGMRL